MKEDLVIAIISGISVGVLLKYVGHFPHPIWVYMLGAGVGSFITTFVVKLINR